MEMELGEGVGLGLEEEVLLDRALVALKEKKKTIGRVRWRLCEDVATSLGRAAVPGGSSMQPLEGATSLLMLQFWFLAS